MSDAFSMKNKSTSKDEILFWAAFRQGSETAYAHLYKNYFHKLYNYGIKFSADTALVEDCLQQLFVELWQNRQNLGDTPSVQNYLYKSFRRKILRKIRQQRSMSLGQYNAEAYPFNISLSHETDIIREEVQAHQKQILAEGLKLLSEKQKEAIFLKFYDRLSYEEISEVMELETKAVYDLVYKGIAKMKKHLKPSIPLVTNSFLVGLLLLFI